MKYYILGCLLLLTSILFSQDTKTYEFKKGLDYGIAGSCMIFGIADNTLSKNISPLTDEEIFDLDKKDLLVFDRGATVQNSETASDISDIFEYGVFLAPAPLLLSERIRAEAKELFVMYGEAFSFNVLSTQFVKYSTQRVRPYVYNESFDLGSKRSKNAKKSFYSGHVSHTATMSIFAAKVFSDMYPDSRWKPIVWTSGFAIPIVTGYLRYKAGQHFASDVAAGLIVGSLIGYFVPELHKIKTNLPEGLMINNSNGGIGLSYRF